MDIVLYYRGPLHANGDAKEKHNIREHSHRQLTRLWNTHPLSSFYPAAANPNPPDLGAGVSPPKLAAEVRLVRQSLDFPSLIKVVGDHQFLPLLYQSRLERGGFSLW
jgi:hypothetical protein